MGCNIPRPWKRPPTPIYEPPKMPKTAPAKTNQSKPVLYKCENCGANLVQSGSSWHCEYCGTKYGIDLGQKEVSVDNFYSDGKLVYQEFSKVAHGIGYTSGTTTQYR